MAVKEVGTLDVLKWIELLLKSKSLKRAKF